MGRTGRVSLSADEQREVVMDGRTYTVRELAALLKVRPSWVYSRTCESAPERIPHIRVGKYIRFTERQVDGFISGHKKNSDLG